MITAKHRSQNMTENSDIGHCKDYKETDSQ